MNQWDLVRSITGMRATPTGTCAMRKDMMVMREQPMYYHWNLVELRSFNEMPSVHCCTSGAMNGAYTITGEAAEPVQYSTIMVYAEAKETAEEVARLLQGAKSHKGDDLFELAKVKRAIIYPVTQNGWLFYDGLVAARHERKQITDIYPPHVVDQIISHGLELQSMPKTKLDDIFTAA
ncbi:hypothetical protein AVT69_gp338 [Pseudomonas phage PhiPA3]|uniref:Uncharacterized protein 340 n=1 Tax=Pseudomonas phage PhiPA3 TaxID=998086 RepID=F8SJH6_BPPA3|nr:hypothetical protein AVT69_gp338 [Pseudomonas phage PhiPA3]AEH03763.1 hypothetical protein [Pseudomonas phage PhiPA3]